MTDDRPRPQYGEYATPTQQAQASGEPIPDLANPSSHATAPNSGVQPEVNMHQPPPYTGAALTPDGVTSVRRPRRWDLIISIALLVYGATGVLKGLIDRTDLNAAMRELYSRANLGTYQAVDLATSLSHVIDFSNTVLIAITALLTIRRLRLGRIAFFIPLIGGILSTAIGTACLIAILMADPDALNRFRP